MKTSEMLLWILGTTLFALLVGANYWGEHQYPESQAPTPEARQQVAVEWVRDPQDGALVPARLLTVADPAAAKDGVIAVLRIPVLQIPGIELAAPVSQGTAEQMLENIAEADGSM